MGWNYFLTKDSASIHPALVCCVSLGSRCYYSSRSTKPSEFSDLELNYMNELYEFEQFNLSFLN